MKTLVHILFFFSGSVLLCCQGENNEPAPGLTKEDIEFGDKAPVITDIKYTMTNNGVAPTTITLTGLSQYSTVYRWNFMGSATVAKPEQSVSFTAQNYGDYPITLEAYRNQQALETANKQWLTSKQIVITVSAPPIATKIISLSGDMNFGSVDIGKTVTRTLTIKNLGTSLLTVTGLTLPTGYSGNWSGTISQNGSQPVSISFTPNAVGPFNGSLVVNANQTSGMNSINLSGIGQQNTLSSGLIAYYLFNGNANDGSGNGYHGTVNGATLTSDRNGKFNQAYYFNGNANTISCNKSFLSNLKNITMAAWIKPAKFSNGLNMNICGQNDVCEFYLIDYRLENWRPGDGGFYVVYNHSFTADNWIHIAITCVDNICKLYVNGLPVAQATKTLSIDNLSSNFSVKIGGEVSDISGNYFQGSIDDVYFYSRALSDSEIQKLYVQ